MANEAMTGTESGSTSRVNVVSGEAPSTCADSMISPRQGGDVAKQQENRQRQPKSGVGQPHAEKGPVEIQWVYSLSSGISDICSGTTSGPPPR